MQCIYIYSYSLSIRCYEQAHLPKLLRRCGTWNNTDKVHKNYHPKRECHGDLVQECDRHWESFLIYTLEILDTCMNGFSHN